MKKIAAIQHIKYGIMAAVFITATLVSSLATVLPANAAGEGLSSVADKSTYLGIDTAITDLQIIGDDNDEVSVTIFVDGGRLYLDNAMDVDITYSNDDRNIVITGLMEDVNDALSRLYHVGDVGTYEVEVILGGGNYRADNGHVYMVVTDSGISWEDARDAAELMTFGGTTGYLATITDQDEHDFIRERISDSGWIGANDIASEGVWRWATGPEAGTQFWTGGEDGSAFGGAFTNWSEGEPNNGGGDDIDENCAQIWFSNDSEGQWNDLACDSTANEYYVVEFGEDGDLPDVEVENFTISVVREEISVGTCDQLFALTEDHAVASISLTADIDCNGRTEAPLFDEEDFSGVFDGNGFTIKNLVIANDDSNHVGLTGYSEGAVWRNLFLDTITVEGGFHSGVLAGHVDESIIAENIHATNINMTGVGDEYNEVTDMGVLFGTVNIEHEYGLSRIEHVSVQGTFTISGVDYAENIGGIAGSIESQNDFVLKQAYADVAIIIDDESGSTENVGGLVGYWNTEGIGDNPDKDIYQGITDSYSWGAIVANDKNRVGGLVGYIESEVDEGEGIDVAFTVANSYSWMDITANDDTGGLIGAIGGVDDAGGTYSYALRDSFFAGTINSDASAGSIIGYYYDDEEALSALTFDSVWYDADKVGDYECVSNMVMGECGAVNADGTQPSYFFNNTTNAPMDEWNFATIWTVNTDTPPTFKPFIGNDADQDGANNYIEDRAPNNGDGNNDSIQDSEQSNVASLVSPVSNKYVTLAVDASCTLSRVSIERVSSHAVQDSAYDYESGFVNFTASGCDDGEAHAEIYYHGVSPDNFVVRKYNPNTNAYFSVTDASVDSAPAPLSGTLVSYTVVDGSVLDIDGIANGTIVDPIGLGVLSVGSPNTGVKRND